MRDFKSRPLAPVASTLLLLFPLVSFGAPAISSVSGTVSEAATLQITGTGFGSGPSVLLFDDFNEGPAGANIDLTATIGSWTSNNSYYPAKYDSLSRSGLYSFAAVDGELSAVMRSLRLQFNGATEAFLSYAVRIPPGRTFPYAAAPRTFPAESAWKWAWIEGPLVPAAGNDDICLPTYTGQGKITASGNDLHPKFAGGDITLGSLDQSQTYGKYPWWSWDNWMRQSFWLRGSDSKFWWQAINEGVSQSTTGTRTTDSPLFDGVEAGTDPAPEEWTLLYVPGWIRESPVTAKVVYDDIYFASGPNAAARVEIGNAPVYENCSRLAIVTPTSWTDSGITATVRLGGIGPETLYLFVVNASNEASGGYPLTSAPRPSAPTNLRVVTSATGRMN